MRAAKASKLLNGVVSRPQPAASVVQALALLLMNQIIPLTVILTVAELLPSEFVNV